MSSVSLQTHTTMAPLEARIAKHFIRLQKTKSRQAVDKQRNAYYTAPGPSLRLLHSQATATQSVYRNKREDTPMEKFPQIGPYRRSEDALQRNERPEESARTLGEEANAMRSRDEPGICRVSLDEKKTHGEMVTEKEARKQEEYKNQQEELRCQGEEDARRRWEEQKRCEEEEERRQEEVKRQEEERRQEELKRQEEDARRRQEELNSEASERQHNPRAYRFHPYMNARDSDSQRTNEV